MWGGNNPCSPFLRERWEEGNEIMGMKAFLQQQVWIEIFYYFLRKTLVDVSVAHGFTSQCLSWCPGEGPLLIKFPNSELHLPQDLNVTFGHSLSASQNAPETECQSFLFLSTCVLRFRSTRNTESSSNCTH